MEFASWWRQLMNICTFCRTSGWGSIIMDAIDKYLQMLWLTGFTSPWRQLLNTYMFHHLFRTGVASWWRILLITTWSWQSTICVPRIPITTRVVQITGEGLSSEMAPSLSNVSDTATLWVHWNMSRLKTELYGLWRQMVFDKTQREYGYDFVKTVLSYQVELRCYSNPGIMR